MKTQPTLKTQRLTLRPFRLDDASEVQRLAGEKEVAAMTLRIPHPYPDGIAEEWINTHPENFQQGKDVCFAIALSDDQPLIGAIGLEINQDFAKAEMGYWVGKEFWGVGHCTEAAQALLTYGFNDLKLNRIQAHHLCKNPASGRVMQKLGMIHEGTQLQAVKKWGRFEDIETYRLLQCEWRNSPPGVSAHPRSLDAASLYSR